MTEDKTERSRWKFQFPIPLGWLRGYQSEWLSNDAIAGVTLAAYAIPVSLAYASLAQVPPQVGVYGYMLGGIGYALFGSSRQMAVGPTSAISLMIGAATGVMANGDSNLAWQIASAAAFTVALLCLLAWLLRLSTLVRLISDSILVGFKAGAGVTIALTQLPALLGVKGGGHNVLERLIALAGQLGSTRPLVLAVGLGALALLLVGRKWLTAWPVSLLVVVVAIILSEVLGLEAMGVPVTGNVPAGLPELHWLHVRLRDVDGIVPLAAGCLLLAYIEGVSAARTFAAKNGYAMDPLQEFLGLGMANLFAGAAQSYPVAGGLSQSAVNDSAGAKTPLALVFASVTLALSLLFLTGWLDSLPKAVLAAIVLNAVSGLIDITLLRGLWRISKMDFWIAIMALAAVLLLGIMNGVLVAAIGSVLVLLARTSVPHVAFLGRMPGRDGYSDSMRHSENEEISGAIVFRPEASLIYVNADSVHEAVEERLRNVGGGVGLVVCDLSASPYMDLPGVRMLEHLVDTLASRGVRMRVTGAHGRVRDLLRAAGVADKMGGVHRSLTLDAILAEEEQSVPG